MFYCFVSQKIIEWVKPMPKILEWRDGKNLLEISVNVTGSFLYILCRVINKAAVNKPFSVSNVSKSQEVK